MTHFRILGIPLELHTNSQELLHLAPGALGPEQSAPSPTERALRLDCSIQDRAPRPESSWPRIACSVSGSRLYLDAGESIAWADRATGIGSAQLSSSLLSAPRFLQANLLECLALHLAAGRRPATLHAAALALAGQGILLTGPAGAGKSTLACACVRAGFDLVAEDVTFLETGESQLTAWGHPWHLHLLPDAPRLFPWLPGGLSLPNLAGECKLRVPVETVRQGAAKSRVEVRAVVSISQSKEPGSRLRPANPEFARACLTRFQGSPPLDASAMAQAADRAVLHRLAHLEIGADLFGTVHLLRRWLEGK